MPSDRELKLRIRSVRSIGQLTKAMKMVASSQIRKVERRAKAGRPYAKKLKSVVEELGRHVGDITHPLLQSRPVEKVGVIVVGSDNGLCGAYNSNLFKVALNGISKLPNGKPSKLVLLGSKAHRQFTRRGFTVDKSYQDWKASFDLAQELADICTEWFLAGEVDAVICFYTEALSMLTNEPKEVKILPLGDPREPKEESKFALDPETPVTGDDEKEKSPASHNASIPFIFEPSPQEALNRILPSYLRIVMLQMLYEAKTSELGSRLNAMTNATDNADKLASELTLKYYRVRQNNITTEIIEISSGAEALNA